MGQDKYFIFTRENITEDKVITEIMISGEKLRELEDKLNIIFQDYCKKNGHKFVLIRSSFSRPTGVHSPGYGAEHYYTYEYKCSICGGIHYKSGKGFGYLLSKGYKREIPQDLYDNDNFTIDGKTCRTIKEEIDELKTYIDYLKHLKKHVRDYLYFTYPFLTYEDYKKSIELELQQSELQTDEDETKKLIKKKSI